jgi:hypothetical protein
MHDPTGVLTSFADAELATLGVRLRRVADTLLAALNPALRVQVACDLADLRGDIESFLNRFANRLDDRSRTSLILAQQELGATIAALDRNGVVAGHA